MQATHAALAPSAAAQSAPAKPKVLRAAVKGTTEAPPPCRCFIIGQNYPEQGGIYAGICRGAPGTQHHLFVANEAKADCTWDQAVAFATELNASGHTDFALPTRAEQSVLFGNVPELFEPRWYWSGEQHAGSSYSAWGQYFGYGHQLCDGKDYQGRARAVRRLLIQSFDHSAA